MLTPTHAVLALRLDRAFSDHTAEARAMGGGLPVLQVVSERMARFALPWLAANAPRAETLTVPRHISFWSEPQAFDAGLEAFLAKAR